MELGEKLLLARQEAGLSQRQLCGDVITRNMLSQIEHGTARPSMDTLRYLAGRLGKSLSFFLEDDAVVSPNQLVMARAREAFDSGKYDVCLTELLTYADGDTVYDRERNMTELLACLSLAEQAVADGRDRYARELLQRIEDQRFDEIKNRIPGLTEKCMLLLGRIPSVDLSSLYDSLPDLDESLMLRGRASLAAGDYSQAAVWLDAVQKPDADWNLLRGKVYAACKVYRDAVRLLHIAEETYPKQTAPELEYCYRELGDFKQAYFYACKQKE